MESLWQVYGKWLTFATLRHRGDGRVDYAIVSAVETSALTNTKLGATKRGIDSIQFPGSRNDFIFSLLPPSPTKSGFMCRTHSGNPDSDPDSLKHQGTASACREFIYEYGERKKERDHVRRGE